MLPDVSILVPFYNVSHYIERCVDSLFAQTFQNIEYVFVNDGSTDDTLDKLQALIEKYPQQKGRVHLINLSTNQGVSFAREAALKESKGEYLIFIDADDYAELDMVELLYSKAKETSADIVVCDVINEYADRPPVVYKDTVVHDKNENFYNMLCERNTISSLWNKLISRKLYEHEDCLFPLGLGSLEDNHVMIRMYYYADRIAKVNKVLYHYVHYNPNSITNNIGKRHYESLALFGKLLECFVVEKNMSHLLPVVEYVEVRNKIQLMLETKSFGICRQYASMFYNIELKHIHRFRLGEKLVLYSLHYRLYPLAQLFQYLIRVKNGK